MISKTQKPFTISTDSRSITQFQPQPISLIKTQEYLADASYEQAIKANSFSSSERHSPLVRKKNCKYERREALMKEPDQRKKLVKAWARTGAKKLEL